MIGSNPMLLLRLQVLHPLDCIDFSPYSLQSPDLWVDYWDGGEHDDVADAGWQGVHFGEDHLPGGRGHDLCSCSLSTHIWCNQGHIVPHHTDLGETLPCTEKVGLLVSLRQACVLLESEVEAAADVEGVLEDRAILQLLRVAAPPILQPDLESKNGPLF